MKIPFILALAAMALAPAAAADRLVILHTNDTHSRILPDETDGLGGVARRKVLVDSVRAAEDHVILVDAGDAVQGTLFFNLYGGEVEQRLMNALDYDLRILGNHEFDNGTDSLARILRYADAEFLSTNYDLSDSPLEGKFHKYAIREVEDRKIGFIALNLRPEGIIAPGNYDGVEYLDAIEAANAAAWWLKHVEGCDMVVALTHIGYDPGISPSDVDVARQTSDIDIIIGGHSHDLIDPGDPSKPCLIPNREGRDVLVAQTGKGGKVLGEITIDLDDLRSSYRLIPVDSRLDSRSDGSVEALLKPYRAGVDSLMERGVGRTAVELPQASDALLNFCTDFILTRGRELAPDVDFAMLNRGGIRRGLPKGKITEGEIITMLPFNNRVQVINIKGSDILPALLQMARIGGSGISDGVRATYEPWSKEKDAALVSVTVDGRPLDPDRTYRVATIDYMANGGDYMPTLANHTQVASSPEEVYKDLIAYLEDHPKLRINPSPERRMNPVR